MKRTKRIKPMQINRCLCMDKAGGCPGRHPDSRPTWFKGKRSGTSRYAKRCRNVGIIRHFPADESVGMLYCEACKEHAMIAEGRKPLMCHMPRCNRKAFVGTRCYDHPIA